MAGGLIWGGNVGAVGYPGVDGAPAGHAAVAAVPAAGWYGFAAPPVKTVFATARGPGVCAFALKKLAYDVGNGVD